MLWRIELKFCIWLCFTVLQIKLECNQFASNFVGVMPLLELRILNTQFSSLFSYMLGHIELKFCIWLCFTVLQIKFECRQFASIFVGEMPLLESRNTENTQFSALVSNMLWHTKLKFCTWLCFTEIQIKFECRQFASTFMGVMPLFELRILEIQFSALFSYMLWHIELKFFIWLC